MRTVTKLRSLATRILCALALVSFGFAAPGAASGNSRALSSTEIAAFMLPDGSLPSLCVTATDGSGKGIIVKLAGDTLGMHPLAELPSPMLDGGLVFRNGSERLALVRETPLRHLLYPPGSGPRAPPATIATA